MGRLSLAPDAAQAAGALILPGEIVPDDELKKEKTATLPFVEHAWAPSNGGRIETDHAVVLENVAAGYKKPNILDVKLGARLWADDAPMEKRVKLDKAAEETTSKPLGFRIAGMKTYQGPKTGGKDDRITADGYRIFDKLYGRSFNAQTVQLGFRDFFRLEGGAMVRPTATIRKVIRRFLVDLQEMADAIGKEESRMYSASLLFVYEGDFTALEHGFAGEVEVLSSIHDKHRTFKVQARTDGTNDELDGMSDGVEDAGNDDDNSGVEDGPTFPSIQSVKLIDFAHAQWTPGHGRDENVLHGIRNVIRILSELVG